MTAEVGERASDAELVTAFRQDSDLFTAVHERYFRDIHRYVASRLGAQEAEDVASETFCVAFGLSLPPSIHPYVEDGGARGNWTDVWSSA
jgi:RNA polymerase sigma-70 factor (ECF subfamily)